MADEGMRSTRLRHNDLCRVCGYKQDLRRDGTLGKHHIWTGHDYRGVCPGTGLKPDETSREMLTAAPRG